MKTFDPRSALIYTTCVAVFLGNRALEAAGVVVPGVHAWLDDLLVLPLALGCALWLQRRRRVDPTWTMPVGQILFAVAAYALIFEVVLPRYRVGATADGWDVLSYALGGAFFHVALNRAAEAPWRTCS